jgi:hypothetical protein
MAKSKITLKFQQFDEQTVGAITRIVGFVNGKSFIDVIDATEDLSSNPRSSKVGRVTADIQASIQNTPNTLPFKTKGVLLAASDFERLERKRFLLNFDEEEINGVLDGGHNTLAIGLHILETAGLDASELNRIKLWSDLQNAWLENRDEIEKVKTELDFLVPVEILVPSASDEEAIAEFHSSIFDICEARNNNVQLTEATKANQLGLYEHLKKATDEELRDQVEWKTNDGGRIKVDDIIALTWIPLLALELDGVKISPTQIYSSKGQCVKTFTAFMEQDTITNTPSSGYARELKSPAVLSAFEIQKDLPRLYDRIYELLPESYNQADGSFGRIKGVKQFAGPDKFKENKDSYLRSEPVSHFYEKKVRYKYPDGFMIPLVYGLRALMEIKDDKLVWSTDPSAFIDKNLNRIVRSFKLSIKMADWDPQKVGKSAESCEFAVEMFKACID